MIKREDMYGHLPPNSEDLLPIALAGLVERTAGTAFATYLSSVGSDFSNLSDEGSVAGDETGSYMSDRSVAGKKGSTSSTGLNNLFG